MLQSGVIEAPDLDLIYPSIAVNEFDDVVIGMTGSGESQFASAYAVAGQTQDGVTTFGDLLLLAAGVADYEPLPGRPNSWGDYSATVVDPSDPHSFWIFQEYVVDTDVWGTRIA